MSLCSLPAFGLALSNRGEALSAVHAVTLFHSIIRFHTRTAETLFTV